MSERRFPEGDWTYGDMYATPPILHLCNRCGERRPFTEMHDELHAIREAEAWRA